MEGEMEREGENDNATVVKEILLPETFTHRRTRSGKVFVRSSSILCMKICKAYLARANARVYRNATE